MTITKFKKTFPKLKPIIGMIHLHGRNPEERVQNSLEGIEIYREIGLSGAIVENLSSNSTLDDVQNSLRAINRYHLNEKFKIGVNILPNEFHNAYDLAVRYLADFIQLDYVSGKYVGAEEIDSKTFQRFREKFPDILVLGGTHPKCYQPIKSSNLEKDLEDATKRVDAIVVTGKVTGKETPIEKIESFRHHLGNFPLIVGAGLNLENATEQLSIADGAIVGSYFSRPVDRERVKMLMEIVNELE